MGVDIGTHPTPIGDAVRAAMDARVATIPLNRTVAVLVHGDFDGNAVLSVAVRAGNHWTFSADATVTQGKWNGPEGAVRLIGSW
jgi:hypothetical protein